MLYKTQKYYDYLEYFEEEDCPICIMHKKWLNKFIDNFFYECVNDRRMRKIIRDYGGFCKEHAIAMLNHGDPLGHSIIYADLIKDYLENSDKKKKQGCLVCDLEAEANESFLKAFLEFFNNSEEFVEKFDKTNTCLCKPHLKALKTMTKDKALIEKLDTVQKKNLAHALECLEEIQRKFDYRFTDEALTQEERTAWQRAVKLMAGIDR